MIIKIKQANRSDGWFIYDNAEGVAYSRHPDAGAFFRDSMGEDAQINVVGYAVGDGGDDLNRTQGSFFDRTTVSQNEPDSSGWYLSFCRGAETFEFWGDTNLFLLNDAGKTIERVF